MSELSVAIDQVQPVQELIEQAVKFRPIAFKDEHGWEIISLTEEIYGLLQMRDRMTQRIFEVRGDELLKGTP